MADGTLGILLLTVLILEFTSQKETLVIHISIVAILNAITDTRRNLKIICTQVQIHGKIATLLE
ncbi:hypothetical protein DP040_05090 [Escherichia coli O109]|nr:hypothetical protein [Escherichia coli O109]